MLSEIEALQTTLSPAEAKVARWVLRAPRQVAADSLADVANACQVSEPTVIRFCRRFGVTGFRAFKARLLIANSHPTSYLHQSVSADDKPAIAAAKVIDSAVSALVRLRETLPAQDLDSVVAVLQQARQIVFCGIGASGHVAGDACHKFFRLGIPCRTAQDAQSILQSAAVAAPGDVFVLISHTGGWPEMLRAARLIKQQGCTQIALTAQARPLARLVDHTLDVRSQEDTGFYTPMSSRLAQLSLLDALQVALALALGDAAAVRLEQSKTVLSMADA